MCQRCFCVVYCIVICKTRNYLKARYTFHACMLIVSRTLWLALECVTWQRHNGLQYRSVNQHRSMSHANGCCKHPAHVTTIQWVLRCAAFKRGLPHTPHSWHNTVHITGMPGTTWKKALQHTTNKTVQCHADVRQWVGHVSHTNSCTPHKCPAFHCCLKTSPALHTNTCSSMLF